VAYVIHRPAPPLSAFVEYLWWLSDEPAHAQERIMASGTQELVINLHEDLFDIRRASAEPEARRFSGAMVSGAYTSYFVVDTRAHARLIGVHFKPGGARPILGIPPGALADAHTDLAELWGTTARELRERLGTAANLEQRFQLLEATLLTRLARPCPRHPAVRPALSDLERGGQNVGQIAERLGLSRRRLIELFTADVGMTPKLFARVQRFQRALALARRDSIAWAELAPRAGYCDQSHLVRDFVSFSGFAPTALVANLSPRLKENHTMQLVR
jgi:AraC-like DNA-binding protein